MRSGQSTHSGKISCEYLYTDHDLRRRRAPAVMPGSSDSPGSSVYIAVVVSPDSSYTPSIMSLLKNLSPESLKTFTVSLEYPEAMVIKDFKDVGSHSWTEVDGSPVLVIPGAPPRWTNPAPPIRVQPDQGVRFVDHTGAQCDKLGVNRLAPLFQSVDYCTPEFDYKQLDIVCNRNNLRNLLHWIEYSTKKDFRIDLHLVNDGKTLVMLEHEVATTEVVSPDEFRGYGDNFRRRTVIAQPGQTRHNRIVTYVSIFFYRLHLLSIS